MKKYLFLSLLFISVQSHAQSTVGQVAHWDLNGTANDISGNGHNGHMTNVTAAAGQDGVMGHAFYFNGVNSVVSIPYAPAFNVPQYTICAVVNPMGFYSGVCDENLIFGRGKSGTGVGTYNLYMSDIPYNSACANPVDSTKELFITGGGDFIVTISDLIYSPFVAKNQWYRIVATFNDTTFKIYVNGILKSSATTGSPGPIPVSTDSLNIGLNTFEPSYPYGFKGLIDDIMLYNRVLADSEIHTYSTLAAQQFPNTGNAVAIYPNPAREYLTISTSTVNSNALIEIYDVMGRSLKEEKLTNENTQIDIHDLQPGLYIAHISNGDYVTMKKFVKE